MAWQWNSLRDINNRKSVTCDFCGKVTTGGITRAKRHQMGVRGDVNSCKRIPPEIKKLIKEAFEKKKAEKDSYMTELNENDDEEEMVQEILNIRSGKKLATSSDTTSTAKRAKNVKGPMDLLLLRNPEATIKLGKAKRQTSINDACDKEARARTVEYIARCFYRNGIPFNVVY